MKFSSVKYILLLIAALAITSCKGTKDVPVTTDGNANTININDNTVDLIDLVGHQIGSIDNDAPMDPSQMSAQTVAFIPKAVVYRTNGDYNNNVMVAYDRATGSIISYPDPSDVGDFSIPVNLGDGWLLDRRGGAGINSVFLTYTYPEYSAFKGVPSQKELIAHIIPGAAVTEYMVLPVDINTALSNPEGVKKYLPKK